MHLQNARKPEMCPWAHFTNDCSIGIQIRLKICFNVTPLVGIISLTKIAHATQLSCHVQMSYRSHYQISGEIRMKFPRKLNPDGKKSFVKLVPCHDAILVYHNAMGYDCCISNTHFIQVLLCIIFYVLPGGLPILIAYAYIASCIYCYHLWHTWQKISKTIWSRW